MNNELKHACQALDELAQQILNSWSGDTTLTDSIGWFAPTITRQELAQLSLNLANDIRANNFDNLDEKTNKLVLDIPRRIQILQANTIPHFFNSNAGQAIPAYISTLQIIRGTIIPSIGLQEITNIKLFPQAIAKRAREANAALEQAIPNIDILNKQISEIKLAHNEVEALPLYLKEISEAKEIFNKTNTETTLKSVEINEYLIKSKLNIEFIDARKIEAEKLIAKCEEAYHITTTKGLAGAFDQRAISLNKSMWIWVAGLLIALCVGAKIGAARLVVLSSALNTPNANTTGIAIQVFLSILSIGAPLWFSWLATKQIGQRFRLAEDYAFKASVAKAYEGYRKEAAHLDPAFERRLFSSALDRLDEAPLRLVENASHGSPWHELVNSAGVQRAFQVVPNLQDQVTSLLKNGMHTATDVTNAAEKSISSARRVDSDTEKA